MASRTHPVENALKMAVDVAIRNGVSEPHASEFLRKYYEVRLSRTPQAAVERAFAGAGPARYAALR